MSDNLSVQKEEVNYQPVGRELDKAVALEVIQIRIVETQDRIYYKNDELGWIILPRFSEDIRAAWELVEIFRQNGLSIHIYPYTLIANQGYRAAVYNEAIEITYDTGLDAPEAICRACLRLFREHKERK